ncbi:MAG: tetratricopeptide repeat protein, partial [Halanaerobiales bacterium]
MYKIKIKIKYIAMVVLILIGLFFARDLIIGEIMYTMGQRYLDDNEELAISYLRKYIQRYPEQDNALEAMDIILQNKVHSSPQVTLSYAGQGGYRYTLENRNKLDLLNKDYEKMLEYHSMNDLQQLQEMMAEFNYQAGNIEKAVEYYQEYLGENIEYLADKERMIFSLATLYLRIGHLDSALSLYNDYISENKILLLPYSKALLGWMYLINGDQEKTDLYIEEINDINMYSTYFNFS